MTNLWWTTVLSNKRKRHKGLKGLITIQHLVLKRKLEVLFIYMCTGKTPAKKLVLFYVGKLFL